METKNEVLISHIKKQIKRENKKYSNADAIYKSKQSFINQDIHRKSNYIPVSNNKDEKKSFVNTKNYESLRECMQENSQWNYMAAGKNSLTRELFAIECDEPWRTSIEEVVEKWEEIFGFQPTYCREHITNGHYQIGLFLEKPIEVYKIKKTENNLYLEEQELYHKRWLTATRLAAYIFNTDIAYNGFNMQNPYCEKEGYKATFYPFSQTVEFEFVYKKLMSYAIKAYGENLKKLSANPNLMTEYEIQDLIEHNALWTTDSSYYSKKNIMFEDSHNKKIESLNNKLNALKNTSKNHTAYDNSYDKKIFVTTTQVVNRWRKCLEKKNKKYTKADLIKWCNSNDEIIVNEVMENINTQYGYTGYTHTELRNRIVYDVKCLLYKDTTDWNKVGFTYIQNQLSLSVRKQTKSYKMKHIVLVLSTLSDNLYALSIRKLSIIVSDKLKLIYDINMKASSLQVFLNCYKNTLTSFNLNRKDIHEIFRIFNDFKDCNYYFYKVNKKEPFISNNDVSSDINVLEAFNTKHYLLNKNVFLKLDDDNFIFYEKETIGRYNSNINSYVGIWLYNRLCYRNHKTKSVNILSDLALSA